jgi:biotin synthase
MNDSLYETIAGKSLKNAVDAADIAAIIGDASLELLPLLHAAFTVRRRAFGTGVRIHVLNNVKSGGCVEDCSYCSQSAHAAPGAAAAYPAKSTDEVLAAAEVACREGAFRYCIVFSGDRQGPGEFDAIRATVRALKSRFPMEICVSAGFLDKESARLLKESGVDRYNHNLNTASSRYGAVCTTHSWDDRAATIRAAHDAGMAVCSGVIIGIGESPGDIASMIAELRILCAASVPVNFFIPVSGHRITNPEPMSPAYCLRVLCAFRLGLPAVEIRVAAGRELHLRGMQSLALYPANSLFANGYLTTGGESLATTRRMIEDAGFFVERIER